MGLWLCLVAQSCPTLSNTMDCSLPGSSVHEDSPGKNIGGGCHALLQGIFPGTEPRSSTLQADSFPSEPQWGAIKMLWGEGWKGDQTSMSNILILLL